MKVGGRFYATGAGQSGRIVAIYLRGGDQIDEVPPNEYPLVGSVVFIDDDTKRRLRADIPRDAPVMPSARVLH